MKTRNGVMSLFLCSSLLSIGGMPQNTSAAGTLVFDDAPLKPYIDDKVDCSGSNATRPRCHYPVSYDVMRVVGVGGAKALSDRGGVVGTLVGSDNRWHAGLWSDGAVTDLGMLGCRDTVSWCGSAAYGLNNLDQVVGSSTADYVLSPYYEHAFVWRDGEMTALSQPGGEWSAATGINNNGVIVGYARWYYDYFEHGWVNINGTVTVFGGYGQYGRATAVNQNDQVVGGIVVNGKSYAFLWDAGTMTLFGKAGALTNYATDVNDNVTANVVGSFTNSGINTHGFLWRPGVMFDLGALPGSDESIARAVNNSGRIVGKSASKAVIWQNGEIRDLNAFLNAAPTVMTDAIDIDRAGRVLALGQDGYNYLLTPLY